MKKIIYSLLIVIISITLVSCGFIESPDDIEYTITFETNGGTDLDDLIFTNNFDSNLLVYIVTKKDNFNFTSWHMSPSLSAESKVTGILSKSLTLYAKWEIIDTEDVYYNIKFLGDNNELLDEQLVLEGSLPHYEGIPTKSSDNTYYYTFISWDSEVVSAYEDKTYKALFSSHLIEDDSLTYLDVLTEIGVSYNDLDFSYLFPDLLNTSNYKISLLNDKYQIEADYHDIALPDLINNYMSLLITNDFIYNNEESNLLNEDVISYVVDSYLTYNIYLKESSNNTLFIMIYKTELEKPNENIEKLNNMKSINDYQTTNFEYSGLPSTGDVDVLVVPLELKGDLFESNYLEVLDYTFNDRSSNTGWESVASYYDKSSHGKLNLNFTITPKYELNYYSSYYESYGDAGDQVMMDEILDDLDSDIDFNNYDFNNDGVIDSIIFIYSTPYDYDMDPWWAWVYLYDEILYFDGLEFAYYMWASYDFIYEDLSNSYSRATYNATTYIHELGHLFGLNDYYHSTRDYSSLGGFDMMDHTIGDHGPLNKILLGWASPLIINKGSFEITLDSYTTYEKGLDQILIIPKDYNSFDKTYGYSEYLVVMYYQEKGLYQMFSDYYGSLINTSGLVIYHVDARMDYDPDPWVMFRYDNYDAQDKYFIRILEADQNNSLNGSDYINSSDILRTGMLDLSTYRWNDNSIINVSLEVNNSSNDNMIFNVISN